VFVAIKELTEHVFSSGNTTDLYPRGVPFESLAGHDILHKDFRGFPHKRQAKFLVSALY
jgi:hypothetical protein